MSDTKFTPGPWRLDRYMRDSIFVRAGYSGLSDRTIVIVSLSDTKSETHESYGCRETILRETRVRDAEANAHLIATAPEIYALLAEFNITPCQRAERFAELQTEATALLAKARGEA